MSTVIRPEVSERHLYFLPKHRFYELRHFCLQYPMWQRTKRSIDGYKADSEIEKISRECFWKSSVESAFELRERLNEKIEMVEHCAKDADNDIWRWLLKGVTEGLSYTALACTYELPCSKDYYYDRFRRFFWLLSRERG